MCMDTGRNELGTLALHLSMLKSRTVKKPKRPRKQSVRPRWVAVREGAL